MTAPAGTRGGDATPFGLLAAKIAATSLSRTTRLKLERGDSPRSGQPVWRNSYYEGQCEDRIWRRYGDGTARTGKRLQALILKAARRLERETRRKRQAEAEPLRCRAPRRAASSPAATGGPTSTSTSCAKRSTSPARSRTVA